MEHRDELEIAAVPSPSSASLSNLSGPRCINGQLVRPERPRDDCPSTGDASSVSASVGVRKPPCFGAPPGISQVPSRKLPPPQPPPSSSCSSNPAANAAVYPMQWTPLNTRPKSAGGGPPNVKLL